MEKNNALKQKNIAVRVDPGLHQLTKLYAIKSDISIQEYVVNLIKNDLRKHGEIV